MLDYTILLAVAALTIPAYLASFWSPLGHGGAQIAVAFLVALPIVVLVKLARRLGLIGGRPRGAPDADVSP